MRRKRIMDNLVIIHSAKIIISRFSSFLFSNLNVVLQGRIS